MRIPLVTAALVLLAACTAQRENGGIDIDPITDRVGDWETHLAARNNSGITGTTVVESVGVGSEASINIAGASANARHPWHVHRGTCASGGPIVGGAESYPVLEVGGAGTASADADFSVGLDEGAQYHVNVHRSPTDLGTIVACGDLHH